MYHNIVDIFLLENLFALFIQHFLRNEIFTSKLNKFIHIKIFFTSKKLDRFDLPQSKNQKK
jgi:hypothetical protein